MKTFVVTDYTMYAPKGCVDVITSKFNIPKNNKVLINVHKIRDAHFQCMNNHYAKFEYKGMKSD